MIELTCKSCKEKVGVESFLAAAQQPCSRCGQLLMGPLEPGRRMARPAGFDAPLPPAVSVQSGSCSAGSMWLGMIAGALAGIAAVVAVGFMGPAIPASVRGTLLGALTGVVLTPVLAVTSFVSMLILPWSIEGMIGGSLWGGMSKAINHGTIRPLILPFLVFVVLPMAVCALGGSGIDDPSILLPGAGLGAFLLGAVLGGVFASVGGKANQPT